MKASVCKLITVGFLIMVPVNVVQFILFLQTVSLQAHYEVVRAPSNGNAQIDGQYEEYKNLLIFQKVAKIVSLSAPFFNIFVFLSCLVFVLCCRRSICNQRYLSIFSFSNPLGMMIALYNKTEYRISKETLTNNKCFLIFFLCLYIAIFSLANIADIGLQSYEIYKYKSGNSDFYEQHYSLISTIEFDANHNSSKNNCTIQKQEQESQYYIVSPYCEYTPEELLYELDKEKKFYDNYVLADNFTAQSVVYLVLKFSFGIYSGLSTLINLIALALCSSCKVGFYTLEGNAYVSHSVFARRLQVYPIN